MGEELLRPYSIRPRIVSLEERAQLCGDPKQITGCGLSDSYGISMQAIGRGGRQRTEFQSDEYFR